MYERPNYELIISTDRLQSTLRTLSTQASRFGTANVRLDPDRKPVGLIVGEVSVKERDQTGASFLPYDHWMAVAMPGGSPPDSPDYWIERLKPTYSQLLVILLLGYGADRSGWRGWVVQRGQVQPLTCVKGIGGNMFRAETGPTDAEPTEFNEKFPDRWSRTEHAVGLRAFCTLKGATVVVIGCSGVGSQIAGLLASFPIRRLGLIDGDVIEPHNLSRMMMATESDIGKNKAMVVASHVATMRSDIAIMVSNKPFGSRMDDPAVHGADLIVTCVDRDTPRLRAAVLARQRLVPHLDIGTGVTIQTDGKPLIAADVRLLLPGEGCVRCVGGLMNLAQAELEMRLPYGILPSNGVEPWNARGRLGSLSTVNAMAAATGVQTWLDWLNGNTKASTWCRIQWKEGHAWETTGAEVTRASDCLLCGKSNHEIS